MISILIPAYNNNETLYRLLKSIRAQIIECPIQIVVSDDASNIRLGETEEFKELRKKLDIEWYYQKNNLGVLSNAIFLAEKAKYKYAVFAQHDDYYIDNYFLSRSVELMENNNIGFVFANAVFENSSALLMKTNKNHQEKISGIRFSKIFWNEIMTSWTSVVYNNEILNKIGGFGHEYTITEIWGKKLSAYSQEEGMAFLYLLSGETDCIVDWIPVSVRGLPPTAFSVSADHPGRLLSNDCLFFVYWNIFKRLSTGNERQAAVAQNALRQAIKFGLKRYDGHVKEYIGNHVLASRLIRNALIENRFNRLRHRIISWKEKTKYKLSVAYRKIRPKK